jgi:hypothetical protein
LKKNTAVVSHERWKTVSGGKHRQQCRNNDDLQQALPLKRYRNINLKNSCKVNRSVAHVSLYIGLKDPEELSIPNAIIGLPKDHDHDSCVKTIEDISQAFPWYTFLSFCKRSISSLSRQKALLM